MAKDKEEKKDLAGFLESVNAKIKGVVSKEVNIKFLSSIVQNKEFLSTGILTLDRILGGGFAYGSMSMVWGPEGGGKTLISLLALRQALKEDALILFVDTERALESYMVDLLQIDVNDERIHRSCPVTMQDASVLMQNWLRMAREAYPDRRLVVIWDSYAATPAATTMDRVDGDLGKEKLDDQIGAHAKAGNMAILGINPLLEPTRACMIVLTQSRDVIPQGFQPPGAERTKAMASWALKHMVKQVLKLSPKGKKDLKDGSFYTYLFPQAVKVKVGRPYGKTTLRVSDEGLDDSEVLLDALVDAEVIKKAGAWYELEGVGKWNGQADFFEWLLQDPGNSAKLRELYVALG